jgi:hypothetical protein
MSSGERRGIRVQAVAVDEVSPLSGYGVPADSASPDASGRGPVQVTRQQQPQRLVQVWLSQLLHSQRTTTVPLDPPKMVTHFRD